MQELYITYLYLDFENVDYDSVKRYGPRDQLCEYAYIYYSKEKNVGALMKKNHSNLNR